MAISKRTRFEVFKRDAFTCRYCGRKSPEIVLEADHIIPKSGGGADDMMNLATSCFDCNSGKSDRNLSEVITGDDPHDKAIELLERERQLAEYNYVQAQVEGRIDAQMAEIIRDVGLNEFVSRAIRPYLYDRAAVDVWRAIKMATERRGGHSADCVPYFCGIMRNWKKGAA